MTRSGCLNCLLSPKLERRLPEPPYLAVQVCKVYFSNILCCYHRIQQTHEQSKGEIYRRRRKRRRRRTRRWWRRCGFVGSEGGWAYGMFTISTAAGRSWIAYNNYAFDIRGVHLDLCGVRIHYPKRPFDPPRLSRTWSLTDTQYLSSTAILPSLSINAACWGLRTLIDTANGAKRCSAQLTWKESKGFPCCPSKYLS